MRTYFMEFLKKFESKGSTLLSYFYQKSVNNGKLLENLPEWFLPVN